MDGSGSDQVPGSTLSKTSSLYCDICSGSENFITAHGFCKTCGEYLCKDCFEYHLKPKPSRNHILLNGDEMPKRTGSKIPDVEAKTYSVCKEHANEPLRFYCPDHKQFYCGTCIALKHKKCDDVEYLPEIASNFIASDNFKGFEGKVDSLVLNVEKYKSKCFFTVGTADKHIDKVFCEIESYKESIIDEVNNRADEIVQKVDKKYRNFRDHLSDKIEQCSTIHAEVESLKDQMSCLKSDNKQCELYTLAKVKLEELEKYEAILSEADVCTDLETFNFHPNKIALDTVSKPNALGVFSKAYTATSEASQFPESGDKKDEDISVDGQMSQQKKSSQSNSSSDKNNVKPSYFRKLLPSGDVDIKAFTGDKKPWVTGITNINENDHIHAIAVYNSQLVAVIDSKQKKILVKKDVQHGPWDVTSIKLGEVIATLPYKNQLLFVKASSIKGQPSDSMEMKIIKQINVSGECYSITNDGEILYVSYQNPGKIECLSLDGSVLRKIEFDNEGDCLFAEPQYIICNAESKLLYVTDWKDNTVSCLSTDGQIKATFKKETLKAPTGITVDKGGNVFVAGYHSNNVIQLSPTFKRFQLVLDRRDRVMFPQSLAFSAKFNKVCIGFRDNEALSVFKVK